MKGNYIKLGDTLDVGEDYGTIKCVLRDELPCEKCAFAASTSLLCGDDVAPCYEIFPCESDDREDGNIVSFKKL